MTKTDGIATFFGYKTPSSKYKVAGTIEREGGVSHFVAGSHGPQPEFRIVKIQGVCI